MTSDTVGHTRIAIIGSGFAGLGTAIRLLERGEEDFVVLERAHDVGGTWRDNSYPGCQCDVPSHLYSFSFAPNPGWTRTYSLQREIQDYLRGCAERFGVLPHVRFGCELREARWNGEARRWELETSSGPRTADVLVSGAGALSEPAVPALSGLDAFTGRVFHSAAWDHEHPLDGERVAVVGTGASAIQFVPRIQPEVERLHIFQRTPAWVMPHPDRPVSRLERRAFGRWPWLQRLVRGGVYWGREAIVLGLCRDRRLMRIPEWLAFHHLARQVPDPELRAKLTPRFTIGCKRILLSNEWYPSLGRPNVELVTDAISEVRERSIVTADGAERPVDTIIFGTGFHVTDMPIAERVRGADGRSLAETWAGSQCAHLGVSVAGFPNFFMLLGPNTGLGHTSVVFMIESQVAYVLDALREMDARGASSVDVRPEVQEAFIAAIDRDMGRTVWMTGGCSSWYLDATGRNSTLWPDFTWRYRLRTRRFEPADYRAAA
jgi:cation diffusion facilitator CzcD-associated flavoprotein CzcO